MCSTSRKSGVVLDTVPSECYVVSDLLVNTLVITIDSR